MTHNESQPSSETVPYGWNRMKWRRCVAAVTSLISAFIFALSGIAKLRDPTQGQAFFQSGLQMQYSAAHLFIPIIAGAELAVAAWLAYRMGTSRKPGAAALVLVSLFAGLLVSATRLHPRSQLSCACYGELQSPLGGRTIISHLYFNAWVAGMLLMHVLASTSYRHTVQRTSLNNGPTAYRSRKSDVRSI